MFFAVQKNDRKFGLLNFELQKKINHYNNRCTITAELGKNFSKGYGSYKIIGSVDFFQFIYLKSIFLINFWKLVTQLYYKYQN